MSFYVRQRFDTAPWTGSAMIALLDVGGEGRHLAAWNLNPRRYKTRGPARGAPIPRLILGRAEAIPLPDQSVGMVIVERTPLLGGGLDEIERVLESTGIVLLRHARPPGHDPHRQACERLAGRVEQQVLHVSGYALQQTVFYRDCRAGSQSLAGAPEPGSTASW